MVRAEALKNIGDVARENLAGKKVFLRLGIDVPVAGNVITDDFRLRAVLPTLIFLRDAGARVLIVGKCGRDKEETLRPVHEYLLKKFPVTFVPDILSDEATAVVAKMQDGEVLLFENIRKYDEETNNDPLFARTLAALADLYVNESFSVSHREEASIVGVPQFLPSFAGMRFMEEVRVLSQAFEPPHPFLFIIGGAKFETKLPLLKKFIDSADHVFVGGALQNDFFKALGYEIGRSLVSSEPVDLSHLLKREKILLPVDVLAQDESGVVSVKIPSAILAGDKIVDAGPETIRMLETYMTSARYILWNGPLGYYEDGFKDGTEGLAGSIARSGVSATLGGGDTLAAVQALNLSEKKHAIFLSTGGGAMLDFLAEETLPGIEALLGRYKYRL